MKTHSHGRPAALMIAGAAAGAGLAAYGLLRLVRQRRQAAPRVTELDLLEEAAVEALRRDEVTGSCAIDVAALAPGLLELTGVVPTHEAADRATRLLHAVTGVRTIVNRLDVAAEGSSVRPGGARRAQRDAGVSEDEEDLMLQGV